MFRKGVATALVVLMMLCIGVLVAGGALATDQTTLTISVTDQNGNAIGGAEVTAEWDDGDASAVTASNGQALIDVPADADVSVHVEHDTYVQNVAKAVDDPSGSVTIQMALPGTAEITVLDQDSQDPVEDVDLRIEHTSVGEHDDGALVDVITTGPNGIAEISGIEQREYAVDTSKPGYLVVDTEIQLDSSSISETIEIESSRVDIEFRVRDNHFSPPQPLADAQIQVDGSSAGTTTSDGTQVTRLDVNDNYEISISKDGYDSITETTRIGEESETIDFSIRRTPEINLDPLQTAVVVGQPTQVTITDAYGDPVDQAAVTLNGESVGATDPQGMLRFDITQGGENTIEAESRGLRDSVTIQAYDPDAPAETDGSADDAGGEESDDGDTDSFGPGFGVGAAIAAIAGLAVAMKRRE